MEIPLHWCHERNGGNFPSPPLVSSNTPSVAKTLDPMKITHSTQGLRIRPGIEAARLQCGAIFPIGMEMLVHNKPNRSGNFSEHCSKGYVLSTAFEHYSEWKMQMKDTRATRISATVFHWHKYIYIYSREIGRA